jgi:hypothetical protein
MRHPREGSARHEAEALEASEANDAMMEAALSCSRQACRRAAEAWASQWLGSPQSFSCDPQVNPALAALLHPDGMDGARGFDQFFGDLREWEFGSWSAAQWAVAGGAQEALSWTLEGGRAIDALTRREGKEDGPRRNALGLAAQRADPRWLGRVLEMAVEHGASLKDLAKADARGGPTALGLALFEWGQALADGDEALAEGLSANARLLSSKGFEADSPSMPAAKLACALAAKRTRSEALSMRPAVALAAKCSQVPGGVFSQAGSKLDVVWAEGLRRCGFKEGKADRFGVGASQALWGELQAPGSSLEVDLRKWRPQAREQVARAIEKSLAALPMDERPLRGLESEALDALSSLDFEERDRFLQKVEMARAAAPAASGKRGPRL